MAVKVATIALGIMIALYFRSFSQVLRPEQTNMDWFISHGLGYLMEQIALTLVCYKIAAASHKLLVKFADTRKVAALVSQCNDSSVKLSGIVGSLEQCVEVFKESNQQIITLTERTKKDCEESLSFVDRMYGAMETVDTEVSMITDKIGQMSQIAEVENNNEHNNHLVENGIQIIDGIDRDTIALGEMQEESKVMAEEVNASCQETRASSEKVLAMAEKMKLLVGQSAEQVEQIAKETEEQTVSTEQVKKEVQLVEDAMLA